ncbi:hypothetical protein [Pseudomonas aeruginosa]|nr:hypothetical protein [Pseudomonas aeruginosa]
MARPFCLEDLAVPARQNGMDFAVLAGWFFDLRQLCTAMLFLY